MTVPDWTDLGERLREASPSRYYEVLEHLAAIVANEEAMAALESLADPPRPRRTLPARRPVLRVSA